MLPFFCFLINVKELGTDLARLLLSLLINLKALDSISISAFFYLCINGGLQKMTRTLTNALTHSKEEEEE